MFLLQEVLKQWFHCTAIFGTARLTLLHMTCENVAIPFTEAPLTALHGKVVLVEQRCHRLGPKGLQLF
jgi:hypothetical protein